ncbi:methyltransferase domain-containing protein [Thermogemmatispora tikiterensis]|uniref:class I SAM-dependent methyltransferase n=1 Tax=Thermogemmatispora tikiterensis TaxID=1825093 RepID=UPI0011BEC291|nr:class I SAM-dependent methyltransferase [Thermogemmatispora tikiterensis]
MPLTCVFVRANVLEGLPFADCQFCYTHQRLLVAAIPARSWPGVVRELVRVTRPGGWIEWLERSDGIQPAGPATRRLQQWHDGSSQQPLLPHRPTGPSASFLPLLPPLFRT